MAYKLRFEPKVKRYLRRLPKAQARRIVVKLLELAKFAEVQKHTPLKGQWKGFYRLRIGDYRAIYELRRDEIVIFVVVVGHRREIYDE